MADSNTVPGANSADTPDNYSGTKGPAPATTAPLLLPLLHLPPNYRCMPVNYRVLASAVLRGPPLPDVAHEVPQKQPVARASDESSAEDDVITLVEGSAGKSPDSSSEAPLSPASKLRRQWQQTYREDTDKPSTLPLPEGGTSTKRAYTGITLPPHRPNLPQANPPSTLPFGAAPSRPLIYSHYYVNSYYHGTLEYWRRGYEAVVSIIRIASGGNIRSPSNAIVHRPTYSIDLDALRRMDKEELIDALSVYMPPKYTSFMYEFFGERERHCINCFDWSEICGTPGIGTAGQFRTMVIKPGPIDLPELILCVTGEMYCEHCNIPFFHFY